MGVLGRGTLNGVRAEATGTTGYPTAVFGDATAGPTGIGVYGQDEWKATRNLKLTLALRVERNSNPVCQNNCFANFTGPFATTASAQAGAAGTGGEFDVPYSSDIKYGQHRAYPRVDALLWSPRLGFSWDPRGNGKTVISGGFGQFYDNPAAGLVDNLLGNPPASVSLRIRNSPSSAGVLPFDPNGAPATWQVTRATLTSNPRAGRGSTVQLRLAPSGGASLT